MFKLKFYPSVMLIALLTMGHIKKTSPESLSTSSYIVHTTATLAERSAELYNEWQLAKTGLSANAFMHGMKGFDYLKKSNALIKNNILSIVDFSKPSTQKRLFIIDVNSGEVLYHTLVAHGRNSGSEYATSFSNKPESHQSSLGFYITQHTYTGSNGYSLKLQGCEKGINDNAMERAIVVHGADYVSDAFIRDRGFLGRSYGCPSLPEALTRPVIDLIKDGSCLFIYYPSQQYYSKSKIIHG